MLERRSVSLKGGAHLLGDLHLLAAQLGSPKAVQTFSAVAAALQSPDVKTARGLRAFLDKYLTRLLIPCELPVIARAFGHTQRNEARELIDLDQGLELSSFSPEFVAASQLAGRTQLCGLRPLRDQRLVHRYIQAVEKGEASAWHTIIYGLVLGLYCVPLRQGLVGYSRQTFAGLIASAEHRVHFPPGEAQRLLADLCGKVRVAIDPILSAGDHPDQGFFIA